MVDLDKLFFKKEWKTNLLFFRQRFANSIASRPYLSEKNDMIYFQRSDLYMMNVDHQQMHFQCGMFI